MARNTGEDTACRACGTPRLSHEERGPADIGTLVAGPDAVALLRELFPDLVNPDGSLRGTPPGHLNPVLDMLASARPPSPPPPAPRPGVDTLELTRGQQLAGCGCLLVIAAVVVGLLVLLAMWITK
ncbi:hypothetical protein [Streptomyces capparidis]